MKNENFELLKRFYKFFNILKSKMLDMCPPNYLSAFDDNTIIEFVQKTEDSLEDIFFFLKEFYAIYMGKDILDIISHFEKETMYEFNQCGYNLRKLKKFYNDKIAYMDDKHFVDLVKKECYGYSINGLPLKSIDCAKTLNEYAHVLHMYVTNNENIYEKCNEIGNKTNNYNYPICLFGDEDTFANDIFNLFPNDLDVGDTNIVSIDKDTAIMMIRDRGHALTIEIHQEEKVFYCRYFIPKLF